MKCNYFKNTISKKACEEYVTNILPELIENDSEQNIFNFDKLDLFLKYLLDRTLIFKGESCYSGKKFKERISFSRC